MTTFQKPLGKAHTRRACNLTIWEGEARRSSSRLVSATKVLKHSLKQPGEKDTQKYAATVNFICSRAPSANNHRAGALICELTSHVRGEANCDLRTRPKAEGSRLATLEVGFYSLEADSHRSLRSFWMSHRVSALFLSWATSSSFSFWLMTLVSPRALRMHGRLRKTSFSMPYIPCRGNKSIQSRHEAMVRMNRRAVLNTNNCRKFGKQIHSLIFSFNWSICPHIFGFWNQFYIYRLCKLILQKKSQEGSQCLVFKSNIFCLNAICCMNI